MNTPQILYSSDKAAKYVEGIRGWVDRNGRFWGENEHLARWSGCTHIDCEVCGTAFPISGYTVCDACKSKRRREKYSSMDRLKWDGETPLYSDTHDEYFFDEDNLRDYLEEAGCTIGSLQLIVCEPNRFREIESGYFCDELSEEGEVPTDLVKALDVLNKVIRQQSPASWSPGKFAAICDL